MKVLKKTVMTTITQVLSPDLKPLDRPDVSRIDVWGVLETKAYATSHPNIGSRKTAIEKEWNKISEELIWKAILIFSKACWYNKWKNGGHIE